MKVYTRKGDDGTTGLLFGGRTSKDSASIRATGAVDEAQAALGLSRAETDRGSELDEVLIGACRELYVLMGELSVAADNRQKLKDGITRVTAEMVSSLEDLIDQFSERFPPITDFVIPGANRSSASLDAARTVVRRAEREVHALHLQDSFATAYLNRLSDLVWTLARWQEGEGKVLSKQI